MHACSEGTMTSRVWWTSAQSWMSQTRADRLHSGFRQLFRLTSSFVLAMFALIDLRVLVKPVIATATSCITSRNCSHKGQFGLAVTRMLLPGVRLRPCLNILLLLWAVFPIPPAWCMIKEHRLKLRDEVKEVNDLGTLLHSGALTLKPFSFGITDTTATWTTPIRMYGIDTLSIQGSALISCIVTTTGRAETHLLQRSKPRHRVPGKLCEK